MLDPPRAGAGRAVIDLLARAGVPRVIHIGCEAASFARDIGLYRGNGYAVEALRVFDAFPLTHHVECVALLDPTTVGFLLMPEQTLSARGSWSETRRVIDILQKETTGGALLLAAAAVALIWANSPWSARYHELTAMQIGTDDFGLHLNLSLGSWAADGLLAIFFFVVGLELKREFVAGDLRDPAPGCAADRGGGGRHGGSGADFPGLHRRGR